MAKLAVEFYLIARNKLDFLAAVHYLPCVKHRSPHNRHVRHNACHRPVHQQFCPAFHLAGPRCFGRHRTAALPCLVERPDAAGSLKRSRAGAGPQQQRPSLHGGSASDSRWRELLSSRSAGTDDARLPHGERLQLADAAADVADRRDARPASRPAVAHRRRHRHAADVVRGGRASSPASTAWPCR